MSRISRSVLLCAAVVCAGLLALEPSVSAQRRGGGSTASEQHGPFGALDWRSIGPLRGGRSIAVAGSAARPLEYYFGATGGGLWKSTDGGTTWRPVTDHQITSSSVGAVAVAPSNPDVVYIGTGESEIRGNIAPGDGVYKSTDGGKTWTHVGLEQAGNIAKIRVNPTNPDIAFVAAFGNYSTPNPDRGIYRTRDGGKTWEKVLYRDPKTAGIEVNFDPNNPNIVYASLWEAFRNTYMMSSGGPGSGLFKSTDGGDHWTELSHNPGLPKGVLGKIGFAVSPADSNRIMAQVEAEDGGTFLSDDAGATWQKVSENRDVRQRAFYYTRVYADPKDKNTFYEPNVGFMKTTDAGKTWKQLRPPHGDNHDMWIDPTNPERFIASNDGGATVTTNGGQTWTDLDFPTAQFYHVITTADVPYHVCGAQQDNSTACVGSAAAFGFGGGGGAGAAASPNQVFYTVGGGESGYIAEDPKAPDIFYAGSYGGLITRFNRKTRELREVNPYPDNPMGYATKDIAERFQWTFPIIFSPTDPSVLYVGSQHLWKTTNGGDSWTKMSPDLTRHDPKTMGDSGGPITRDETGVETYATIFTIAPSPKDGNLIWTGSDDGYVFVTRDGGKNWTNVTPKGMPDFSRISLIEASPFRAGTAYVAANHYQFDDLAPYVYRTDDYGQTWTKIVNGVKPRDYARAIREDTQRAKMLYLGTEHGIYISFDDGANWQSLDQNLPDTPVHDIKVADRDLVIATHGRGFYIMDDISPLRQWGIQTSDNELTLFRPQDALRGLDRTLSIDYQLKQPAQKVTMDFLDAHGNVIRSFSGTAEDEKKPAGPPSPEDFRRPRDPKPPVAAGLHRVNWDLRYTGAVDFPGMIMWAASTRGPIAPPGTYSVRVTADGQTATQPFAIRREPHVLADVTDADLQKQFDLAMQISKKTSEANEAVLLVRGIRPQIEDRTNKLDSKTGPTAKALDDLKQKLTTVETAIYQTKLQSGEDPLNFPIMLNNKIAAIQGVVESADDAPTEQSYEVFQTLSGQLNQQLNTLDSTVKTELPKVNQLLERQKLEPIKAEPLKPEEKK
ncbi:MAG: VPS10 domain-containing protein [Betaproteobacteria bacterium]